MKILFLAGGLELGGAERQLYYIIKILKSENYDVKVLVFSEKDYYHKKIEKLGVKVEFVGGNKSRILRIFKVLIEVYNFKPDVFQSSHSYTNIYVAIVSKFLGIKSIGAIRSNYLNEIETKFAFYRKMALRISNKIVCNSINAINNALKDGISPDRLFFLPNAIDLEYFKPNHKPKNDLIKIIFIGGLRKVKKVDRFIKICSYLQKNEFKFEARIVGSGKLENELKILAEENLLYPPSLTFFKETRDILRHYHWSDILILTSDYEGTPNVIMEAMACGVIVFTNDVGDVNQLINNNENGFVFYDNNYKSMSNIVMSKIVNNQSHFDKFRKTAREIILKKHGFDSLMNNLAELYKNV